MHNNQNSSRKYSQTDKPFTEKTKTTTTKKKTKKKKHTKIYTSVSE